MSNTRFLSQSIRSKLLLVAVLGLLVATTEFSGAQTLTVLYSFTGVGGDGAGPLAGVVLNAEGNIYGTTDGGGDRWGYGTAYEVNPSRTETVLHIFNGGGNAHPDGGVILDAKGNLYGTTSGAGACPPNYGTVFEINEEHSEKVVHRFSGTYNECFPVAGLVMDAHGNLYGTTNGGVGGTVFELTPPKKGTKYTFTSLYTFCSQPNCADGAAPPYAGVLFDAEGNLYGTTELGGVSSNCTPPFYDGCGTVFKLTPSGVETVLYTFCSQPNCADGANPHAGVVFGRGNLYGTTGQGGDLFCGSQYGCGIIFKLALDGTFTVLHTFADGADGGSPTGDLVLDAQGDLYGTAAHGGVHGYGTVFELAPDGTLSVLHSFTGGADGGTPLAGMVFDGQGNLYGTTYRGGDLSRCYGYGCGTVFKLTP